ncbi:C-type lectin-like domain-containing protein [Viscerimonas tarda]
MKQKKKKPVLNRDKHLAFSLNSEEYDFVSSYIKKYKISNKSRWIRETVLNHILKTLDQDYPTLFGENEMRR